jgi:signal transduction histidine kinase/ActR/RegA family two-component response regulator
MVGAPSVPLRRRLFLLAASGIVPLVVMSAIGFAALARQQRHQAEIVGREFAQALATAVDAELQRSVAVLLSTATTVALDRNDLAGFHERAQRVVGTQPSWTAVTLADPSGKVLVDSRVRYGIPPPPIVDRPSFDRVVRTHTPVAGNLDKSPQGEFVFPVCVPVIWEGTLRYVLTAVAKPDGILTVITRQQLPDDWIISIFDANGRRVARSRAHDANLGGQASKDLQAILAGPAAEGVGQTVDLEGNRNYASFSRLKDSGWTAVPGIPAALIEAGIYRSLAIQGLGIGLSIMAGIFVAVWVARSINRPIGELRAAARALGRREPMQPPDTPIQEIRDVTAAIVTAADDLTRGAVQREELLVKERHARETAEAAVRAKDEFLAVVSHELRTPLNAVYGWARMLQSDQVQGADAARALEAIVRNADVQVQIIDDLLDVSRIISGKMRLDVRSVDPAAAVEAALDAVRPAAEAKTIRIQKVLDPRAGPVTGDPARLQQVLWNLLMNAVKFTPKGGRVQVHLQRINFHIEIVVSDTGQGIAPEILPYVFDRFRQADSSSTRAHQGLGLGLALVKHLVELHGGAVVAQSAGEGTGATFVVTLPLTIAAIPEDALPRVHPSASSIAPLAALVRLDGLRVLAVDDDPEAGALTAAILARAGADVRTCFSAPEALRILRQWHPDVLVSDIEMPDEDGYALIRKVRGLSAEDGGKTPAVALTAYGRPQDRTRSITAGYTMHVPKPVDPREMTAIIASVAGRPTPMSTS